MSAIWHITYEKRGLCNMQYAILKTLSLKSSKQMALKKSVCEYINDWYNIIVFSDRMVIFSTLKIFEKKFCTWSV